ncbi:MAG TPA: hypothetical protein VK783_00115 [Bacteroidia bacterium]|jgi:hypothetical protein|nr:hypothetical protein [Bacteroidia bacterium]
MKKEFVAPRVKYQAKISELRKEIKRLKRANASLARKFANYKKKDQNFLYTRRLSYPGMSY